MTTTQEACKPRLGGAAMQGCVDVTALGWSLSIFSAVTVLLCAAAGWILPASTTHFLAAIVPAFDWRDPQVIAIGTGFAFVGGWYIALAAGSLYNLFHAKR